MATNPLVKLKRGAYNNIGAYPNIDGQLYIASDFSVNAYGNNSAASDNGSYNVILFDIDDGTNTNNVVRRKLDAYRSIYSKYAAEAGTAGAWANAAQVQIKDSTSAHTGTTVSLNASENTIQIPLPSTITATLDGRAASALKLVTSANADVGAGSAAVPVYFSDGVPVACNGSLDVDITGNAASATRASRLIVDTIGSNSEPVYFSSGNPVKCNYLDATKLTGTIPLSCIPATAQERLIMISDDSATLSTLRGLSASSTPAVEVGDVVKNNADGQLYYVVSSSTTIDELHNGDIGGTSYNFVKFTAGSASTANYATAAGRLQNGAAISIAGAVSTSSGVNFDGNTPITLTVGNLNVDQATAGTLAVGYGGTGQTSWTQWGVVYASASNALANTGAGTAGYLLQSNETSAPNWINPATLTVGKAGELTTNAKINGTNFTGHGDVTTSIWGTARNVSIVSSDGTGAGDVTSMGASTSAYTLKLPATIKANLTGNADTATTADTVKYTIALTYTDATGKQSSPVTYGQATDHLGFDVSADNLFPKYSTTYTPGSAGLAAGTWATISTPSGMNAGGTYIVQIYTENATSGTAKFANEYFSGIMSFSIGNCGTNQIDSDEVLLHACGKGISGKHIYFRTRRTSSGIVMEMSADVALVQNADKFTIKFRRIL